MIKKYLIVVDEQDQNPTLSRMKLILREEGFDLEYIQIDPQMPAFQERNGDEITISLEKIIDSIASIPFFKYADTIACDYNLVPLISGFDIICKIRESKYNINKKIILYSAGIEVVISEILLQSGYIEHQKNIFKEILTKNKPLIKKNIDSQIDNIINNIDFKSDITFEQQIKKLELITTSNIHFIKKDNYFDEVIKNIKKDKEFEFESELIEWFHRRDNDIFNYLFPKYQGKSFGEIAIELESKSSKSIEFKKDLIEQLISYICKINGLDNA